MQTIDLKNPKEFSVAITPEMLDKLSKGGRVVDSQDIYKALQEIGECVNRTNLYLVTGSDLVMELLGENDELRKVRETP